MTDFDIEAYLEQQVSKTKEEPRSAAVEESKKDVKEASSSSSSSRHHDDKDRVSRHRRDDSHERRRDSRDRHRDYRSSRRSRSSSRKRYSRRSRSRSPDHRRRSSRSRSPTHSKRSRRDDNDDVPPKPVKSEQELMIEKYQVEYEKERKKLEEEAKRIEEEKEREVNDLTKDQRTIFVGQLTMKVNEANLQEFFGQVGIVKNVIMIRDKATGKHKGFGYVEMKDLESIPACLLFNNAVPDFQKFPILVKASEAEKNFVAKKESISSSYTANALDPRVYIGNIHVNIDEDALRVLVEPFGPIDSLTLHRDELGNSKGYAFVRYRSAESAQMAMTGLAGMELVGRALKVGPVLEGMTKGLTTALSGSLGDMLPNGQLSTVNWKLDDDDGSKGMQLNAQSRHMLMAKLAQGAGMSVPSVPVTPLIPTMPTTMNQPAAAPAIQGIPSRTFVISNMFDLASETEPNWDHEIREDVTEECRRYGQVELVYVEKRKPGGLVYVKFHQIDAAVKSAQNLHGRYFAGKMITIAYVDTARFDSLVLSG